MRGRAASDWPPAQCRVVVPVKQGEQPPARLRSAEVDERHASGYLRCRSARCRTPNCSQDREGRRVGRRPAELDFSCGGHKGHRDPHDLRSRSVPQVVHSPGPWVTTVPKNTESTPLAGPSVIPVIGWRARASESAPWACGRGGRTRAAGSSTLFGRSPPLRIGRLASSAAAWQAGSAGERVAERREHPVRTECAGDGIHELVPPALGERRPRQPAHDHVRSSVIPPRQYLT